MIPPERRSSVNRRLDLFRNLPVTSRSTTACTGGVGDLRSYAAPTLGAARERRERGGGVWHMGRESPRAAYVLDPVDCCASIAWGGSPYIGGQGWRSTPPPLQERRRRGGGQGGVGQGWRAPPSPLPPNPNPRGPALCAWAIGPMWGAAHSFLALSSGGPC